MLQAHAHGNAFSLHLDALCSELPIYVACRVSGSKNDGAHKRFARICFNATHLVVRYNQRIHTCLEVYLATTRQDGVTHVLDDARQLVRTDVRMCIHQDGYRCAVLTKDVQYLLRIAPLLAARIEFSVAISTGTTFTKAIVRLAIHTLLAADTRQVFFTFAYILSALNHHGAKA